MCDHHNNSHPAAPRHGSSLSHGTAHADDHARWSRRDFMSSMGLAAIGGAMYLGGTPVRAFGQSSMLAQLRNLETDRILVLVQLSGGNDGINTLIPVGNDIYYNARPGIAITQNNALQLPNNGPWVHPSLETLTPLYGAGNMGILYNVGYPDPSLSHFSSTDIWMTGSDSNDILSTGWVGRYLADEFPTFNEEPLDFPLAVQLGGLSSMLFQGPTANMGMSLASPELFERIAEEGILYEIENLPNTTYGAEMEFVRTVANNSFIYADAVQSASAMGTNDVEYPQSALASNLEIVAQLIKGQLGSRIYHVSIGGFDNHANQGGTVGVHANLLRILSQALSAFMADLGDAWSDKVMVMTFSEFGRRVNQNGSNGTDHGTAAPLFLFGGGVEGGLYGDAPDLTDLDGTGNLKYKIDFRSVYATVLQDWFGLEAGTVDDVLGSPYSRLGFVSDPATPTSIHGPEPVPEVFVLHQNYPNPFNPSTNITYTLHRTERVTMRIYDTQGRLVQTLVDGTHTAGSYSLAFDAGHLPSGVYLYRMDTPSATVTKKMTLLR